MANIIINRRCNSMHRKYLIYIFRQCDFFWTLRVVHNGRTLKALEGYAPPVDGEEDQPHDVSSDVIQKIEAIVATLSGTRTSKLGAHIKGL